MLIHHQSQEADISRCYLLNPDLRITNRLIVEMSNGQELNFTRAEAVKLLGELTLLVPEMPSPEEYDTAGNLIDADADTVLFEESDLRVGIGASVKPISAAEAVCDG